MEKPWEAQRDVCRCCLGAIGIWYINAQTTLSGVKKNFVDILQECYGISLAFLSDSEASQVICVACAEMLKMSWNFRKSVLAAEEKFCAYFSKHKAIEAEVKTESEVEYYNCYDNFDFEQAIDGQEKDKLKLESDSLILPESLIVPEVKTENINNVTDADKDSSSESDSPLTLLKLLNQKILLRTEESDNTGNRRENILTVQIPGMPSLVLKSARREDNVLETPAAASLEVIAEKADVNKDDSSNQGSGFNDEDKVVDEVDEAKLRRKLNLINNKRIRQNIVLMLYNSTIIPFQTKLPNAHQFTCLYCTQNYLEFNLLKQHVRANHDAVTEKEIFDNIKQETLIKADVSVIRCKLCQTQFTNIETLIEHLTGEHQKEFFASVPANPNHGILGMDMSASQPKCHKCSKNFVTLRTLLRHMSEHYANFVCDACGKKFMTKSSLVSHREGQHSENGQYHCFMCDEKFVTKSAKYRHMKKHNYAVRVKCAVCNLTYKLHMQTQQDMDHAFKLASTKCDLCGKYCATRQTLKAHKVNVHLKYKKYPCHICNKVFHYQKSLDLHLVWHTGVKNFECGYCKSKFLSKSTLRVHVMGHTNEKRYSCDMCKAAFIQKHCLRSHIQNHHRDIFISKDKKRTK